MQYLMKKFLMLLLLCSQAMLFAQLEKGAPAKNFVLNDVNNTTHNLHSILESGKAVILDFSASWCSICWNYHTGPNLKNTYTAHGPSGSNKVEILFIEGDLGTSPECLYGSTNCIGGSRGNWTLNTPYPVINLTSAMSSVVQDYQVVFFPTIYIISPDKRVYDIGRASQTQFESYILNSFQLKAEATIQNASCISNGEIKLNVTGGYLQNTYKWSNGATTKDLANLAPGNYSVTITDANGYNKEYHYTIAGNPISLANESISHPKCFESNDGSITINPTGGTGSYAYKWSNGAMTNKIDNLKPGIYSVVVTDAAGCTIANNYVVNEAPSLNLNLGLTPSGCENKDGRIIAFANGGTGTKTYKFNNEPFSTSNLWINVGAGNYTVAVKDALGCITEKSFTLAQLPTPIASINPVQPLDCINTSATLQGKSSIVNDSIKVDWTLVNGSIIGKLDTNVIVTNKPGTYWFRVKNIISGCKDSARIDVSRLSKESIPNFSFNLKDGILELNNESMRADSIKWILPNGVTSKDNQFKTSFLTAGRYNICLESYNLCGTERLCKEISYVKRYVVLAAIKNPICANDSNGSIELSTFGGVPSSQVTYNWTGPGTFKSSNKNLSGLKGGKYTLVVNDIGGVNDTLVVDLLNPAEIKTSTEFQQTTNGQSNGSIFILVSGGVSPFTYNWSNGGTTQGQFNLAPGFYAVTITDKGGCKKVLDSLRINLSVGTNDEFGENISLYPNPTSNYLNLDFHENFKGEGTLSITNGEGKLILSKTLNINNVDEAIDVSSYAPSLYYLVVKSGNKTIKKRFVVLR